VKRKQRLIAYFFVGQVGQGLVAWDDLAKVATNLWDGKGLGGSQKGDLDLMEQMFFLGGFPHVPPQPMSKGIHGCFGKLIFTSPV